jgi:DNA polymerase-4
MERIIFHIDVNSAFLSWEAVYRLKHLISNTDLRDIPSAVGGSIEQRHGIILAKSIPAKKYKIQTGESIPEALKKCPNLVIVPPNYNLYEQSSKAFISILREYSPTVEQYSIDECFMDMTGTRLLWGEPVVVANEIKDRIRNELGFTVNIGVSSNKLLAKMAGDFRKPDLVHTLFPSEISSKMWPLPVSDLFYVGRATNKKLLNLGITTIGQLAHADTDMLYHHFKSHGKVILAFANGIDESEVEQIRPDNKGYGNSTTIAFDAKDTATAKKVLLSLSETVAARLRKDKVKAGVVSIGIKDSEFRYIGHQMVLDTHTNITSEIHQYSCKLFDELWDGSPIRHLGIHTTRIVPQEDARQLSFLNNIDFEKQERLDTAVDKIRLRYGIDAIKRATFINAPIDHLGGGISREKRTVDYSKIDIR